MISFNFNRDKKKGKLIVEPVLTGRVDIAFDEDEVLKKHKVKLLEEEIKQAVEELLPEPHPYALGSSYMNPYSRPTIHYFDDCRKDLVKLIVEKYKESI